MKRSTARVSPSDSLLARGLEPLVQALGTLFILVSVSVAAVWACGLGEGSVERAVSNPGLRSALVWLLAHADLGWLVLAAANVHLAVSASVGLATARRWALLILGTVAAFGWLSVSTGFPLGHIRYGAALGLRLGPVPLGLPLFWFTVIVGARTGLLRFRPQCGPWALAAGVGLLALLTDLNLEPLAAKYRGFWFWTAQRPGAPPVFDPPWTAPIIWGVLAGLLAFFLREKDVAASARKAPWQPGATFAIMNAVFLAGHIGNGIWH